MSELTNWVEKPRFGDSRYWIIPPEIYQSIDQEFHFNFDPCPYPALERFYIPTLDWKLKEGNESFAWAFVADRDGVSSEAKPFSGAV
ncbi:MAG: hypothetical protein ACRDF4_09230 [Rhabdochlamydiaceae bacterium]